MANLTFEQAIIKRIEDIAISRNMTISKMALRCAITPTTFYELRKKGTVPTTKTIKRLCDGIGMKMSDFFDVDYIDNSILLVD